ncbi:mqo [Symbiodinium sp. CCMP2592]|nr:mqo [Symbiodinium sp. CCMP2592]
MDTFAGQALGRRMSKGDANRILRSGLEPSQLSQLDSAAPWVLGSPSPGPRRRARKAESICGSPRAPQRAWGILSMGRMGASTFSECAATLRGHRKCANKKSLPLEATIYPLPDQRLAQTALTSSYPKLEGLQPEPAQPSLTGSVQQVPYQTLLAGQSPRPYYSYTAPPPAPPAMLARGQPTSTYVQPSSTGYRYTPSVPSSYREGTTSNLGSFNVPATPAEGAPFRYSLPAASSPTRHPGPPTEPVQLSVPLQPAEATKKAVQSGEVQSMVVPDLRLRYEWSQMKSAAPASQAGSSRRALLPAARAPISLPGVVQNKLAASLATSQLVATESPSVEHVEKPAVEVLSPAHGLLRTDLGIQLGVDLPKGLTSPEAKAVPSYAASNGGSSTARSLGSPGRLRSKLPPADEGGSHAAGLSKRLSAGADDVVNTRDRYRGEPKAKKLGGFFDCLSCFSGLFQRKKEEIEPVDVILVGGGIMSATTGLLLKQLEPSWRIVMIERLDAVAQESSNAWNNAGTGHSALCEPNYTPQVGKNVDIHKAVTVNENFQLSRQYWAYLAKTGLLPQPERFIHTTPHMTFARGEDQISWLKKRLSDRSFDALKSHTLFEGMEYSDDRKTMEEWAPLMMAGRKESERCALSRVPYGTDVDFGELTKELTKAFLALGGEVQLRTTVSDLHKDETALYDESWIVSTRKTNGLSSGSKRYRTRFVFVGAGGYSLPVLQRSGIPEIRGFMGFPISGEFLVCQNPDVASKHVSKVYGKAAIGAPPMSVPHLDARRIGGQPVLLFGPFAGFSPRFLKSGSLTDLFRSIRCGNVIPAAAAGLQNLDLSLYLLKQLMASKSQKLAELRQFVPDAKAEDWTLVTAGQRVQIIKGDPKKTGILQFGTEVVAAEDGSLAGLLGASPGASTAVQAGTSVLASCFPEDLKRWSPKLREMIPSFGCRLSEDAELAKELHQTTSWLGGLWQTLRALHGNLQLSGHRVQAVQPPKLCWSR